MLKWIAPLLSFLSSIGKFFERKQLIDLGKAQQENETLKSNEKAQKDKRRIHSDIERDPDKRRIVRDFFR